MPESPATMMEMSENKRWHSVRDLLGTKADAAVALVGAPLGRESITPGHCDLAPQVLREALRRMSVYDLETGTDLKDVAVFDTGDVAVSDLKPAEAFEPIKAAVAAQAGRGLTILAGGNNAVTRPGVHGLDRTLAQVGLMTLDAHFDLRDTDGGLNNGNPIAALLEDGLPGDHISQIGLLPFANTAKAHDKAKRAGISVRTAGDCRRQGFVAVVAAELERLAGLCDAIYVDFDIDVIDRAQMPAAPGARPGGIAVHDFFAAARLIAAHPKVRVVDLAEFDPSLDVAAIGALTAARWFAELLAGFSERQVP
ncbi:formimidoylglutamase [Rhizomicrobium electricum]|uniref:Formimidoylglutamase n=2 Tax=Rhizomicrobium electricum TaxID=480070 RepID=A0ABP3Q1K4_9PROT|nr:arginase family protein [Rhizomicrobium electricum]